MTYQFIKNFLVEGKPNSLSIKKLPYELADLTPVFTQEALDYHYNSLAKTYAKRYNAGEGDMKFNEAGVFLHNLLFEQFQSSLQTSAPSDQSLELITKHYSTFAKFKQEFAKVAMSIQGSGWCYLSTNGTIKTIKNHEIKNDIALLVDWWEHAWWDYKSDKKGYLDNQWSIINWDVINQRL